MICLSENAVVEHWRPIPGAEGFYSVSNLGHVRSEPLAHKTPGRQRGRVLKTSADSKGYLWFRLQVPRRPPKPVKVHRAVAMPFLGMPREGDQVNHKNGNKRDNRLDNLEYVTCKENIRHCWQNGLHGIAHLQGEANPNTHLTSDDVIVIRKLYPQLSYSQLARMYKVTKQTIRNVVKRITWKHV